MGAVIVDAVRTPMCRGTANGGYFDLDPVELLAQTITALLRRANIAPTEVDVVLVQSANPFDSRSDTDAGQIWPATGLAGAVPAQAITRTCRVGEEGLHVAAQGVRAGVYQVVVVAGVASTCPRSAAGPEDVTNGAGRNLSAHGAPDLLSRHLAAELVAAKWGLDREQLDRYAVRSHRRASAVAGAGEFDGELIHIEVPGDPPYHVTYDEAIDPGITVEQLGHLRPPTVDSEVARLYPEIEWIITSGNSAQRADGASAMLIMSELRAKQLCVRPRARFHGFAVAADDPGMMLTAPLRATDRILTVTKTTLAQIDHVEIDEAFACLPLAWLAEFPIGPDLVNPRGGALALGNALGCSSIRMTATMLNALEATGGRFGLQAQGDLAGSAYATLVERL